VPPKDPGVEVVKMVLIREMVSEIHKLCLTAAKQLKGKTAVSGLAAAAVTCIQSLAEKEAPAIAASVGKEVGKAQAQAADIESALDQGVQSGLNKVRDAFKAEFSDDCISSVVQAVVQAQVRAKLGKFAGGLAQKIKLIGMYESKAVDNVKTQEGIVEKRMEKLFGANKLRKQVGSKIFACW
jgi:hypothetical protein